MAHEKYTGRSAGSTATFGTIVIPGWREITIEENGKPLPTPINTTVAGASAYEFTDDPLGGKTANNCTVTISGLLSVTDHQDASTISLLNLVNGASATLVILKKTGEDTFTLTSAVYKKLNIPAVYDAPVPYTISFSNSTSSGAWT